MDCGLRMWGSKPNAELSWDLLNTWTKSHSDQNHRRSEGHFQSNYLASHRNSMQQMENQRKIPIQDTPQSSSHWAHPTKGSSSNPTKNLSGAPAGNSEFDLRHFSLSSLISQSGYQLKSEYPERIWCSSWTPEWNLNSFSEAHGQLGLWDPPTPSLLHWDWPQRPQNLPNTEIIIVQMLAKWSERSWDQDHNMGTPLFSSLSESPCTETDLMDDPSVYHRDPQICPTH